MAVSVTYRGTVYTYPETDEEDWGDEATAAVVALLQAGEETEFTSAASEILSKDPVGADLTIADGTTLEWVRNVHAIQSDGGAVTVDATTGIAAGEVDQQKLLLMGLSDTDTVEIAAAGNCDPNGAWVSRLGHWIEFRWDATNSIWRERGRSH